MKYFVLAKHILKNQNIIKTFSIEASQECEQLIELADKCYKYEEDTDPNEFYDFNHPGGAVALSRCYGIYSAIYAEYECDCDDSMTEFWTCKDEIIREDQRLKDLIITQRENNSTTPRTEYRVIDRSF